jgi:hypothetical protein
VTVDWNALEQDVQGINHRVPAMGATYRHSIACPATLGRMGCVKVHDPARDPVHVASLPSYGVVALWSECGGPPQINAYLVDRIGLDNVEYVFGTRRDSLLVAPQETV